jgi:hypothetical protein
MRKQLSAAIVFVMLIVGYVFGAMFLIAEANAIGPRNCDVNEVPFEVDVNLIYQPQFIGWRENVLGDSLSMTLKLGNTQLLKSYIIEANDLPDGISCSSNPPRLIGNFTKAGIWYSHLWVHISGSAIKTESNQGILVFKVYDINDANLPYIEMNCGN